MTRFRGMTLRQSLAWTWRQWTTSSGRIQRHEEAIRREMRRSDAPGPVWLHSVTGSPDGLRLIVIARLRDKADLPKLHDGVDALDSALHPRGVEQPQ